MCDELASEEERKAELAHSRGESIAKVEALKAATMYRQRIMDIPDPDDELLLYMPSHAVEGGESGLSEKKAQALCRRLVAVHCLYGVDKNPLAVELAKLSLWLESHSEGYPLTFLDHRLALGDSLTGPFIEHLVKNPGQHTPLDEQLLGKFREQLLAALQSALKEVAALEATVGINIGETLQKQQARQRMEQALLPFKALAAAWSGGVMLGAGGCDDWAYAQLLKAVAETGALPETLPDSAKLRKMLALGLGVDSVPAEREALLALTAGGGCNPALAYELAFPKVFYPDGDLGGKKGFDVVLGNPPWDTITINRQEWFASYNFEVLNAPSQRERDQLEQKLLINSDINLRYQQYEEGFEQNKRANDVFLNCQKTRIEGKLAGRFLDEFRLFMERNYQLLASTGMSGVVVPSAFHANEGATGVRRLYLEDMALRSCFSFENRRKLFEIDSRFKFATVVAERTGPTSTFSCAYYLHDDEWLFKYDSDRLLSYSLEFVKSTGGLQLTFLEISHQTDLAAIETCILDSVSIGSIWDGRQQSFSTSEINLNLDKGRLSDCPASHSNNGFSVEIISSLVSQGYLPLIEGKHIWHYSSYYSPHIRYCLTLVSLLDKQHWFALARYYRSSYRKIASSTNERTMAWTMIPPGAISSESCPSEQSPWNRPNSEALKYISILNCFTPDFAARLRVATTVSMFMLRLTPISSISETASVLLGHSALRLLSSDGAYEPLWREQVGEAWREEGKAPFTWPVLQGDDERWAVRAAIDAVVADAYGLSREQYEHVLSTFSHKSYPNAPQLCLAAYDELKQLGLEAFTRKHDPYWNIPLNESLPKPVIDIPIPEGAKAVKSRKGSKQLFSD